MSETNNLDLLAAEYVIGTLSPEERLEAKSLEKKDAAFIIAVQAWEYRLEPLNAFIPEVAPSPELWTKIERRLTHNGPNRPVTGAAFSYRKLVPLFAMIVLALGLLTAYIVNSRMTDQPLIALLEAKSGAEKLALSYDRSGDLLTLRSTLAPLPDKNSYELWVIAEGANPVSIGVIDEAPSLHPKLSNYTDSQLSKLTLAVSLEPKGGSPTGQPTGPVLMTGNLGRNS